MAELPKNFPWKGCEVTGTVMVRGGRRGLHQRTVRVIVDDVDADGAGNTLLLMLCGYKFRGDSYFVQHLVISDARPVKDSPHTIGTLLWAARGAYGDPYGQATWDGIRWTYSRPPTPGASGLEGMLRHIVGSGPTEFDALVNALRALETSDV